MSFFSNVGALINRQPVYFMALISATLVLVTAFGLHLSVEQAGAIQLFAAAILTFVLQRIVTPTAAPALEAGTEVSVLNTEDTVIIQPSPPGPIGINEGNPEGDPQ